MIGSVESTHSNSSSKTVWLRILGALMVILTVVTPAALVGGTAAQAADQRQMCSLWNQSSIESNAVEWGRISQRVCIEWVNYGNKVRAKIQARFDWPMGSCTISVPGGATCPLNRLAKNQRVELSDLTMNLRWQMAGETVLGGSCAKGHVVYFPLDLGGTGSAKTIDCYTAWHAHPRGTYSVQGHLTYRRGSTVTDFPTTAWWNVKFS